MNCSTPGFPVLHHLPELAQTHVHWVSDAIQPISSSVIPFSSCLQSFPASGAFLTSQLFASGGQSIEASSAASVFSMNIQDWFPLGLTRDSLVAQRLKCLPPMWETWVRSLGWEDPLEKETVTHSSILTWRIPWTEKPGSLVCSCYPSDSQESSPSPQFRSINSLALSFFMVQLSHAF